MQAPVTTAQIERITLAQALWQLLNAGIEIGKLDTPAQQQQPALIPVPVKY